MQPVNNVKIKLKKKVNIKCFLQVGIMESAEKTSYALVVIIAKSMLMFVLNVHVQ